MRCYRRSHTPNYRAQQTNCDYVFDCSCRRPACIAASCHSMNISHSRSFSDSVRGFCHIQLLPSRSTRISIENEWSTFDANDVRMFGFERFAQHAYRFLIHGGEWSNSKRKLTCLTRKRHTSTSTISADEFTGPTTLQIIIFILLTPFGMWLQDNFWTLIELEESNRFFLNSRFQNEIAVIPFAWKKKLPKIRSNWSGTG